MDENIKEILARYDQLAALILDQKVDEFADKLEDIPLEDDDYSYETYLQKLAAQETEAATIEMENEPDDTLGGLSMKEYFKDMPMDKLTEILEYCAVTLDRGIPDSVIDALANQADKKAVVDYSKKIINDAAWVDEELNEEDDIFEIEFQKVKACFKVLIRMGENSMVETVLDRFMSYPKMRDFVADSIAEYIEAFPETSTPIIIGMLDEHLEDGLVGPSEDLIIMLTNIGKQEKSEDIYSTLRKAFRYMENKIYAVICIADYGDDRFIPLFKNYINRHQDTIDRDLFYEMMSAIQNLGGDISDISDPFGDFQKKQQQ